MKNLIWKYSLVLILSWCLCPLMGQSDLETKTLQLFDSPISWLKHFDGLIDGVHESKLCLAFDGINCRGYMDYTSSKTQYLLEGTLQNEKLILLEKINKEPSGFIEGTLVGNAVRMQWKSIDDSDVYTAKFDLSNSLESERSTDEILVLVGFLDEQNAKAIVKHNGAGSLEFVDGKTEKLFATSITSSAIHLENMSAGYKINLINTKAEEYEASFILPGAKVASHLKLQLAGQLEVLVDEYLSHTIKVSTQLPDLGLKFNEQVNGLIADWNADILKHKDETVERRFANEANIWFDIESYSNDYVTGILHYNTSWNKNLQSKSFTYNRKQDELISLAPFLKGSTKWESAIKEKMLAARTRSETADRDSYQEWIENATLIEPVLCEGGLQFFTESNVIFGQASTFMSWKSLSPLVISSSKLNKLRKIK